jgi:hypothetical protein
MQFLENKKWLGLILLIVFSTITTIAQQSSKIGWLTGSIGYVDKVEGFIPASNVEIKLIFLQMKLISDSEEKIIVSDQNGDYLSLSLPIGKYCVSSVQDKDGKVYEIDSKQRRRCFEIKKKQTTRFDIIFEKN